MPSKPPERRTSEATGATGLVPFPYLWRAVVGALAGATVLALGLFGVGPLALLAEPISNPWTETFQVYDRGRPPRPAGGPVRWSAPGGLRGLAEDLAGEL